MFPSIMDFKKQFLTVFAGRNYATPITVPQLGTIPVIATPLSADNYVEARKEDYPVFSIADRNPTFSGLYNNDVFNYHVLGKEIIMAPDLEDDDDPITAVESKNLFYRSFLMEFFFDVSFATKKVTERDAVRDLFLKTFGKKGFLTFDGYEDYTSITYQTPRIKETVEFTVERVTTDREDGVLQEVYQFVVTAWISSGDPALLPLVKELNVNAININLQI